MKIFSLIILLSLPNIGSAQVKVMTTTMNLKSLVDAIGKEHVKTYSFCKGTQDPHFLEAKPSYMFKAAKADLLVSIGLDLEIGWLPLIIRGARNPKLRTGNSGSFIAGDYISTLEKPMDKLTRADGDVHADGNPHFLLDPMNALIIAEKIKEKLSELSPENKKSFENNYNEFKIEIDKMTKGLKKTIKPGTKVISYHKTLSYFYHRFGVDNINYLEPKPGVPPTPAHIIKLIKEVKKEGVHKILVENYFDTSVADRISRDLKDVEVIQIPVSVKAKESIIDLIDLYKALGVAIGK